MPKLIDLTGQRYGRLVVLERAEDHISVSGRHYVMWECVCDCGNHTTVSGDALRNGKTQSCGCYARECASYKFSTHRMTTSKIYGVWCSMKSRCLNSNVPTYKNYGGRGITVCNEWQNSFESFYKWSVENGYENDKSIDRINNDLGYFPENCRWVDKSCQANNRTNNHLLTYKDETHNITEWATIIHKNPKTLFSRLYSGWTSEDILTK